MYMTSSWSARRAVAAGSRACYHLSHDVSFSRAAGRMQTSASGRWTAAHRRREESGGCQTNNRLLSCQLPPARCLLPPAKLSRAPLLPGPASTQPQPPSSVLHPPTMTVERETDAMWGPEISAAFWAPRPGQRGCSDVHGGVKRRPLCNSSSGQPAVFISFDRLFSCWISSVACLWHRSASHPRDIDGAEAIWSSVRTRLASGSPCKRALGSGHCGWA